MTCRSSFKLDSNVQWRPGNRQDFNDGDRLAKTSCIQFIDQERWGRLLISGSFIFTFVFTWQLLIASMISDLHQQPTFPSINMSNGQTPSIEQVQIQYWPESFAIHQNRQKFPSSPPSDENTLAHPVPTSLHLTNSNFSSLEESDYPKREASPPVAGKTLCPIFRPYWY